MFLLSSAPVREGKKTLVTSLTAAQFVLLHVLTVEMFSDETVLPSLQCFNTKRAGERRTCPERPIYALLLQNVITLLLCRRLEEEEEEELYVVCVTFQS